MRLPPKVNIAWIKHVCTPHAVIGVTQLSSCGSERRWADEGLGSDPAHGWMPCRLVFLSPFDRRPARPYIARMIRLIDMVAEDLASARPRHPEKAHRPDQPVARKPAWIRVKAPGSPVYAETQRARARA